MRSGMADMTTRILIVLAAWTTTTTVGTDALAADAVPDANAKNAPPSFNHDVKPILSTHCFACHGPDEHAREAKLRLDTRDGALADLDGYQAVVPGKPAESEMYLRITSDDRKERMPPHKFGKPLSGEQIETLRKWIAGGATYEKHWAFVAPERSALPQVKNEAWSKHPIDRFVLAQLEKRGMSPSPVANRYALIRRVYLDLIGLPPTPAQADAFVADKSPNAYEKVVDELLASKHYGERWARQWLDLARYADTNGYEKDRPRSIWPYRDWVIHALNADMPFDQFTIEQIAGDMMVQEGQGPGAKGQGADKNNASRRNPVAPGPWPLAHSRRIATGFHRNTMLNEEGGIDPLEYRFYAMVDRVATTGSVWLGLTTGCAQCHTHKYDPITHTDYYQLMALLNNADEPDFAVPDDAIAKRRDDLQKKITAAEAGLPNLFPPAPGQGPIAERRAEHFNRALDQWIAAEQKRAVNWRVVKPTSLTTNLPKLDVLDDGSIFSSGDITKRDVFRLAIPLKRSDGPITALRLEVLPDERLPAGGPGRSYYEGRQGDFFLSEVAATVDGRAIKFATASHSFGKISIGSGNANATNVFDGNGSTGWATAGREAEPHQLVLNLAQPIHADGDLTIEMLFERHFAASLGRFRWSVADAAQAKATSLPVEVEAALASPREKWSDAQRAAVVRQFTLSTPLLAEARKKVDALRRQWPSFHSTLVMQERPADNPRPTHRHHRGEYLQPKEKVSPALPSVFDDVNKSKPTNRLELARWLVSKENPLAARVAVNRAWQAFFGRGIVETAGDFGTQGSPPTHPKLLDWLAVAFMEQGWSQKQLHRLIVTSQTYQQSADASKALLARDPANRWLARGPRFRLPAETIRDNGLAASGLLSRKLGGPSVFPPQPASVTALAWGGFNWNPSKGEDRYRRSLYTFAKRTSPFAAYTVFNGPTGESCVVRRDRSNTPLQALTMLNDEMFIELARALATEAMTKASSPRDRATSLFRRCVIRPPTDEEVKLMLEFHAAQLKRLNNGELKAAEVLGGNPKPQTAEDAAAWTMLARAVMNLDEFISKP